MAHRRYPFAGQKFDRSNEVERQERRDWSRTERWDLRRGYRKLTNNKRVQSCGRPGAREDGSVVLRLTDATGTAGEHTTGAGGRVAGYGGLFSCGNVHVCPVCSAKISAERASELERVLAHYLERGGWAVLVTLTMRHWDRHSLQSCVDGMAKGWNRVNKSTRAIEKERAMIDYAGFARALEVTRSPVNGWHVHVHAVIVFNSRPSDDALAAYTGGMFARWSAGLVDAGMPAPSLEHGIDVQQLDPDVATGRRFETAQAWARYVTKGIAGEALLGPGKDAIGASRSIRELMRDAVIPQTWEDLTTGQQLSTVDPEARDLLLEYETVMRGRRQITWSQKRYDIRKVAGLDEERTDEEIAEQDVQGEDVAVIPSDSWHAVEPRATELASVAERQGPDGARAWLDQLGVEWWMPTGLTDQRRHGERPGQTRYERPHVELAVVGAR